MRTTQTNTAEKIGKKYNFSVPNIGILLPTTVALTLTSLEKTGGET